MPPVCRMQAKRLFVQRVLICLFFSGLALFLLAPSSRSLLSTSNISVGKPESWSVVDPVQLAACIEHVLPDLPLNPAKQCAPASHHYDARTKKWNEEIRFIALAGLRTDKITAIHYIGGNINASDAQGLQHLLPGRIVHITEPVPSFFVQLQSHYRGHEGIVLHNVGMANSTRNVTLPTSVIKGQSTVVMGSAALSGDTEVLSLVSPQEFAVRSGLELGQNKALLHANCEGCEYEMLEAILDAGLVSSYPVIQVSFHYVPEVSFKLSRYCSIRVRLQQTHKVVASLPWGWERFVANDILL